MGTSASLWLDAAEDLMYRRDTRNVAWWPRAVAWLLRLELEQDLAAFLATRGVSTRNTRAKLLMLYAYLSPADVRRVAAAWYQLSAAGHHHSYGLAPTQAELAHWYEEVRTSPVRPPGSDSPGSESIGPRTGVGSIEGT
jgi:hypothetical protein